MIPVFYQDTLERVVVTFLGAFLTTFIGSGLSWADFQNFSVLQKAALAGVAASLSLVKSLVGRGIGSSLSASLLPRVGTHPPAPPEPVPPAPAVDLSPVMSALYRIGSRLPVDQDSLAAERQRIREEVREDLESPVADISSAKDYIEKNYGVSLSSVFHRG